MKTILRRLCSVLALVLCPVVLLTACTGETAESSSDAGSLAPVSSKEAVSSNDASSQTSSEEVSSKAVSLVEDKSDAPDADLSQQTVVYKRVGEHELTVYIYKPTANAKAKTPLLVLFPGGGWHTANNSGAAGYNQEMNQLRANGFTVAVANYRVRTVTDMFGMVSDCFDAIRYLVKYADVLKIDTDRIFTGGHSAGGYMSVMAAMADHDKFTVDSGLVEYEFKVKAAAPKAPPLSFVGNTVTTNYAPHCFKAGYSTNDLIACSPLFMIEKGKEQPDLLLVYGTADTLILPAQNTELFYRKCQNSEIKNCEVYAVEGGDHSLLVNGSQPSAVVTEIVNYLTEKAK
ncbi:MAG: alpha/beta hydrolase [Clostridia bacterium]|nr:alpha/beta hydrolase [Clostridia bacterium]